MPGVKDCNLSNSGCKVAKTFAHLHIKNSFHKIFPKRHSITFQIHDGIFQNYENRLQKKEGNPQCVLIQKKKAIQHSPPPPKAHITQPRSITKKVPFSDQHYFFERIFTSQFTFSICKKKEADMKFWGVDLPLLPPLFVQNVLCVCG
mmetsp:Transcript_35387/g.53545  ORF Transcript_35387/g.53545 Transcript_35387/m.53545 type:complete len:147 (-) Transcript_35387:631-1071(-)